MKTPAPGLYPQKSSLSKIGHFITPARPLTDHSSKLKNPGPGSYTVKPELFKVGNNTIIGNERGREKLDTEKRQIPGPGVYKAVKATTVYKSSGNITIGNSERKGMINEGLLQVPGPGNYNDKKIIKGTKAPAYGMGTGPKDVVDLSSNRTVPGPGLYSQSVQRTKVGAAIGNDPRFKEKKNQVPGPGTYRLPSMVGTVASYHNVGTRH